MHDLNFDSLPKAVSQLCEDMAIVKQLLFEKNNNCPTDQDQWFDLNELVGYDPEKRTKPTFYGYISKSQIPHHKRGKKIIFLKSEIDLWLKAGRKKTHTEIQDEASSYLLNTNSKKYGK